jgi:hypothetical protein
MFTVNVYINLTLQSQDRFTNFFYSTDQLLMMGRQARRGAAFERCLKPAMIAQSTVEWPSRDLTGASRERLRAPIVNRGAHFSSIQTRATSDTSRRSREPFANHEARPGQPLGFDST